MANTVYANFVLENKIADLLETKLDTRSLMTIDYSLAEDAGITKTINKYTYAGSVESVAEGAGNTVTGAVTFVGTSYIVGVAQQKFAYSDEDQMKDPYIIDAGLEGMTQLMVNDMNAKYFAELAKTTNESEYTGTLGYDAIVDAIDVMNIEDESGLFLIINPSLKAEVRKDDDFKSANIGEILFNGMIGSISGVPVIVSKKSDVAYLATVEAVKLFTKKENEIEQERDADTRTNSIFARKVNIVALVDEGQAVKIIPTV